jgi:hypothetical protein
MLQLPVWIFADFLEEVLLVLIRNQNGENSRKSD